MLGNATAELVELAVPLAGKVTDAIDELSSPLSSLLLGHAQEQRAQQQTLLKIRKHVIEGELDEADALQLQLFKATMARIERMMQAFTLPPLLHAVHTTTLHPRQLRELRLVASP